MDTLPDGMTEEEFQSQLIFALVLRNSQECARARELIASDCMCRANPEWYNCAETANRLIADIVRGVADRAATHPTNSDQLSQLDSSS